MARVIYRTVTCNAQRPDGRADNVATVKTAWARADVLCLQEAADPDVREGMRQLGKDARWYNEGPIASQNPIIWRHSKFEKLAHGYRQGYGGKAGMSPARGVAWVLLRHRASGERSLHFNAHQIHQAFTSHPERQPIWDQIHAAISAEIKQVVDHYNGVPAVICGDWNKDGAPGTVNFLNVNEREIDTPATFGSRRYDRFFLVGSGIDDTAHAVFATRSDHKAIQLNVEILTKTAAPKPAAPTPAPAKPKPVAPIQVVRGAATYKRPERWRFFATRLEGDGTIGELIHPNLPLQDVEIEDVLTGHNALTGHLTPEFRHLIENNRPAFKEWRTAIWAEESGNILGGGILTDFDTDGPNLGLEVTGYTGYLVDLPYTDSRFFVEADPLSIFRHVWAHVQQQPQGNLGLEVDALYSGLRVGTELEQVEFDTQAGPVSFEAGPVKLAWYQTHDLAEFVDNLATETPFDWHEEHYWQGGVMKHRLRLGYPKLGRKREDLRFVIGENVAVVPKIDHDGESYATEVLALGAGEGSAMKRGTARRNAPGLRRVAVVVDPSQRSQTGVNTLAKKEVAWRSDVDEISEIVVRKHPHADMTAVRVGDEIRLQGDAGWNQVDAWFRVVSRRIRPLGDGTMSFSVQPANRQAG